MLSLTPRFFILPAIAVAVILSLPGAGQSASERTGGDCGSSIASIQDPGLREHFAKIARQQSPTAAKACALFSNAMDTVVR